MTQASTARYSSDASLARVESSRRASRYYMGCMCMHPTSSHVYKSRELARASMSVRRRSLELGIPSIDIEDGYVLYTATAIVAAGREGLLVVDAGAGIGHSSLWLGQALEDFCLGKCTLVAVEQNPSWAREAEETLSSMGWRKVLVRIVVDDALSFLERLDNESVRVAFIDIEKKSYPRVLELLAAKLEYGGIALFHNAYFPLPREFYEAAGRPPWVSSVVPTSEGVYILVKTLTRSGS